MTIEEIQKYLLFQKKKYYLKSFVRKAKRLIADFIPLSDIPKNYKFHQKTIRTSQITKTYLPKTLDEKDNFVETILPEMEVFGLQNVYFSEDSTAFLSEDGKQIFYEQIKEFSEYYSILYNTDTLHFHSHNLVKISNHPRIDRKEEVLFLAGTFNFNYFHFLLELLPKVEYLKSIPNYKKLTIVLGTTAEKNTNFQTILSFFIKDNFIEYLEPNKFYSFAKTWHITCPNTVVPNIAEGEKYQADFTVFSKDSIDYVRDICLEHFDIDAIQLQPKSKIFLARKSKFRQYNEHEVLDIAKKYNFEPVYFEDCSIHEQIFFVRNADYIIGPSGAAWTNIIFCEENKTKGLMWLGKVWNDFSVFSTLAQFVNFDLYHYRYDQESPSFHANYELPVLEFEKQLKKLLLK